MLYLSAGLKSDRLLGIVLFSGSLYALTLSGISALGMVTPFGGLTFLAGWLCLGMAAWKLGGRGVA